MRGVVDEASVRYLPWIDKTAMVHRRSRRRRHRGAGGGVAATHAAGPGRQGRRHSATCRCSGSEIEFFLFKEGFDEANAAGYRDLTPNSPYVEDYHILQTTKEEDVLGAIRRHLAAAGMPVEFSKGEAGRGQHELNLTYQTAVEMADINLVFKNAVKEIAHTHGKSATFMAKPFFHDAGSSCHIHSSLWSTDGEALMPESHDHGDHDADDHHDRHHMSQLFRWYLGGLMATARDFSLLFAPTINSYKRFQPGSWAPTGVGWDVDNRTLGFRVVGHGKGMRVESRIPGADANTYHAFAATIAGGLYGIEHRIEPPAPYNGNGYTATDIERIPWTFTEAIQLWRDSSIARECFGEDVHHHVLVHAEAEWLAFNSTVTEWERQRYFERI